MHFIHFAVCVQWFLFRPDNTLEYRILFILSSVDGHLAMMSNAAVRMHL